MMQMSTDINQIWFLILKKFVYESTELRTITVISAVWFFGVKGAVIGPSRKTLLGGFQYFKEYKR